MKSLAKHGDFDPQLNILARRFLRARRVKKEAEAAYEIAKKEILEIMGECESYNTDQWHFMYRTSKHKRWNGKALDEKHPELTEEFKTVDVEQTVLDVEAYVE